MFSYLSPDTLVLPDHPLRTIRSPVDAALEHLWLQLLRLYYASGRASLAPETLLR